MPTKPAKPLRTLAVAALVLCLALLAAAPGASASPFGEVGSIGSRGTANGQFSLVPSESAAIGVDPTDNSVYVVDDPSTKGEIRIQKFSTTEDGKFKFLAAAKFKPKGSTGEEAAPTEGVAVDPLMHRVYVLALNERSKAPDKEWEVASEVFAFSTEQKGEELPPAAGTTAGLLATTEDLKPMGTKFEESLLEPSGIAVEPIDATHDNIVLMGLLDTGSKTEKGVEIYHSAVWRVNQEGRLQPAKRWVDTTDAFEEEGRSPAVFNGKLYAQGEEGIYEIPTSGAPKPLTNSTVEREEWFEELGLWLSPAIQEPFLGAGMTVGPEGTFWASASIKLATNKNNFFPGAVSYDQTGTVLGWTGGQSAASPGKKCFMQISGTPLVAAGKEWKAGAGHVLFMLDDNFSFPKLIQFGPGGEGCPTAEAASPTAAVSKVAVEESQPIPIAATVEFASKITQGNALSAEWNFGDGTAPVTVTKPEHQEALVSHKFVTGGTHTVTVKIHTDDLASPTVEATSHVTITAEPPPPPKATTGTAASAGPTSETLKGAVNPNGGETTCRFEYGTTTSYGKSAPCATQPGSGKTEVAVQAEVTGLGETTSYHYRLVAENAEKQTGTGNDREFTTSGAGVPAPKVKTEPATGVGPKAATLNAKVNPEGSEVTECKLEYGTSEAYGSSVPCSPSPGAGSADVAVSGAVTGLTANTTYHFRVRAKNSNATAALGTDTTFKTAEEGVPPAPKVKTEPASGVATTEATLNAKVNPEGSEVTECKLEYGTSEAYGSSVPCLPSPGAGSAEVAVSGAVTGLTPNTTYHFRVRAKNTNPSASFGNDATLKTTSEGEPSAPGVKTEPPATIQPTAATLKAVVNAQGSPTECKFEYGPTEAYGSTATCMPTPGGSSPTPVSANVGGLAPDTTYHYRVWAKNANVTPALGADVTFRTKPEEAKGSTGGEEPPPSAGGSASTTPGTSPPPGGGVKGQTEASPDATIAGSSVSVSPSGAFTLKVSCPAGAGTCIGSVVVRTASAVAASAHASLAAIVSSAVREVAGSVSAVGHAAKKSILMLSSGSFSVAAGQTKTISLHLSAKARKLLAKFHTVRAKATITARNTSGATHTGTAGLTLKAKKKK